MIDIEMLQQTQEFWDLESRGIYHEIVSLIISQRIAFSQSRKIRSSIYKKIDSNTMTYDKISSLSGNELKLCGLDNSKISVIRSITNDVSKEQFMEISGIGNWTYKAFLIQTEANENPDILLVEDLWIRNHLVTLYDLNPKITAKQVEILFGDHWTGYKTAVTKFLWRLSKTGLLNLKKGLTPTKNDFI